MSRTFVIAGTDTDVGKTVFAAALCGALGANYWKPIQCGLDDGGDAEVVRRLSGLPPDHILPELYRFAMPASPHRAAESDGVEIDIEKLVTGARRVPPKAGTDKGSDTRHPQLPSSRRHAGGVLSARRPGPTTAGRQNAESNVGPGLRRDDDGHKAGSGENHLIIEGAGGLMVPLTRTFLQIDLFARWKFPIILCARTALGTINHSLLSIESLRCRDIPIHGIAFIGDANADSERTICEMGQVRRLGRLPHVTPLNKQSLAAAFAANFRPEDFA